jgi:hypothetical protein
VISVLQNLFLSPRLARKIQHSRTKFVKVCNYFGVTRAALESKKKYSKMSCVSETLKEDFNSSADPLPQSDFGDSPPLVTAKDIVQSFKDYQSHRVRAYTQLNTAHKSYLANPLKDDAFINSTHVIGQAFQNINLHVGHLVSLLEELGDEKFTGIIVGIQALEGRKIKATAGLYSGDEEEKVLEGLVEEINE